MIYLHVPFCKRRCIYCDFYSTTCGAEERHAYVDALCRELKARHGYLPTDTVRSIYFGGGTPSLLNLAEIARILTCIRENYHVTEDAEITLEANPDDIGAEYAQGLRTTGINRVSLGVQSFDDRLLRMLNRRHDARQAETAVRLLRETGTDNISIDLIYGLPGQSLEMFGEDLRRAFALPVTHLSAYALSVEEGTAMERMMRSGELEGTDEELFVSLYEAMMDAADRAHFIHYEISNFALSGYHSRHNSAYWNGTPYLGCGPGAHSYDGVSRRANRPDLKAYINAPEAPHETETLTPEMRLNELVFTSLRTQNGLDLNRLTATFGEKRRETLTEAARPHLDTGRLALTGDTLRLTRKGIFTSDDIISDLFV